MVTPHLPPDQAANALLPQILREGMSEEGHEVRLLSFEPREGRPRQEGVSYVPRPRNGLARTFQSPLVPTDLICYLAGVIRMPIAALLLGERLEPDQTASDLLEQAEALARAGDLRGAIRKAYIALLCELGDRKVISLAQHKTNRDYLTSVRNRRSIYDPLRKLTNSFELHWYGFVPPAAGDWEEFLLACRQALRTHASGVPSAG